MTAGWAGVAASLGTRYSQRTGQTVINRAVGGKLLSTMDTDYATNCAPYYNATSCNTFHVLGGTNEMMGTPSLSAMQASMTSLLSKAKLTGWTDIYVGTIPDNTAYTAPKNVIRNDFNTWLKANYIALGATGISDIAALPESAAGLAPYYIDGTHPTDKLIDLWTLVLVASTHANSVAAVTTPAAFAFTDITNATPGSPYTSDEALILGINAPTPISVSGGSYSVSGGAFTSSSGTVVYGDKVRVLQTSAASNSTATNATVTIGGVSDTYTVTTSAAGAVPDTFNPAQTHGNLTLSESNGRATNTGATGDFNTRSIQSRTTGKVYFEIEKIGSPQSIGICNSGLSTAGWLGQNGNSNGLDTVTGAVAMNGGSIGSAGLGSIPDGSILGIAIDFTAAKVWYSKNGVFGSGQVPASGTGGFAIPTGAIFAAFAPKDLGASGRLRTVSTQFLTAPPSGFTAWVT